MYNLTNEDKKILEDYKCFMEEKIASSDDQGVQMALQASVDKLSGEMDSQKLQNYIEYVFAGKKAPKQEMSEPAMEIMNQVQTAAKDLGFMMLVKRFREGSL